MIKNSEFILNIKPQYDRTTVSTLTLLAHVCKEKIEKICKCHNKFIFIRIFITREFVNSCFVFNVDNNEDKPQLILECKIL